MSAPRRLAAGLLRWTARHPDWHPGVFGAEVASYAGTDGEHLLLIDPLVPGDDPDPVLTVLDGLVHRRVAILVTMGYHTRSAAALFARWRDDAEVTIHGPPPVRRRLDGDAAGAFCELDAGAEGPGGVRAFAIGRPRRGERPLWLPSHAALAFGDSIVTTPDGELRMWIQEPLDERREAFYRERFAPTLEPLLALPMERVLVTHGEAIVDDAASALRRAVASPPWYHHG